MSTPAVPPKPASRLGTVAFLLGLAVVFAGVSYFLVSYGLTGIRSPGWPTADAQVTKLVPLTVRSKSGKGYAVEIEYRYTVGGTEYTGTGYNPSDNKIPDELELAQVLTTLAPGSACKPHYNPSSPGVAYIKPGAGVIHWLSAGMGGLIGLIAAGLAFVAVADFVRRPKPPAA